MASALDGVLDSFLSAQPEQVGIDLRQWLTENSACSAVYVANTWDSANDFAASLTQAFPTDVTVASLGRQHVLLDGRAKS